MKPETSQVTHKIVLAVTFLLFFVCFARLGVSAETTGPAQLVEQYCIFDQKGARLTSEGFDNLKGMFEWEGEPGWDSMVVIKGFKLGSQKKRNGEIIIPVSYDVLGVLDGWKWTDAKDMERSELKEESRKEFELEQIKGKWKITAPVFRPHVGVNVALGQCRAAWPSYVVGQNSDGQMEALREALAALEKLGNIK